MHEFKCGNCTVCILNTSLCTLVQNVQLCMIALAQGALVQQLLEFMILFFSIIKLSKDEIRNKCIHLLTPHWFLIKFSFSEKATKICAIFLKVWTSTQTMRKIAQIFVPFSEKLNFTIASRAFAPKNSSKVLNGL